MLTFCNEKFRCRFLVELKYGHCEQNQILSYGFQVLESLVKVDVDCRHMDKIVSSNLSILTFKML